MTRKEAGKVFFDYCTKHNVDFRLGIEEETPYYYAEYPAENAPECRIESTVDFRENEILLTAYYSRLGTQIVKESVFKEELLCVLNFLNDRVLYKYSSPEGHCPPRLLYAPRFFMTNDGVIVLSTVIPYEFFEVFTEETEHYITSFCPRLLDGIAVDLFLTAYGELDVDDAVKNIRRGLFGKK